MNFIINKNERKISILSELTYFACATTTKAAVQVPKIKLLPVVALLVTSIAFLSLIELPCWYILIYTFSSSMVKRDKFSSIEPTLFRFFFLGNCIKLDWGSENQSDLTRSNESAIIYNRTLSNLSLRCTKEQFKWLFKKNFIISRKPIFSILAFSDHLMYPIRLKLKTMHTRDGRNT